MVHRCHFYYLKNEKCQKRKLLLFISKKPFLKNHKMSNLIHHIILMSSTSHLIAHFRIKGHQFLAVKFQYFFRRDQKTFQHQISEMAFVIRSVINVVEV